MLNSSFKVAIRTLLKHRAYNGLNIAGLAIGIAASIFILQYVAYERSYDKFHSNYNNLYRVQYQLYEHNQLKVNSATAVPRVAPFMKEIMPEVENYARVHPLFGVMSSDNKLFRENRIYFADPSLLSIFDFKLLYGDYKSALQGVDKIVITKSIALKYFGEVNVTGKVLTFNSLNASPLEITAVTEDVPANSHFKFDFLISYATLNSLSKNDDGTFASEDSWDWSSFYTYILLKDGTNPTLFNQKFQHLINKERNNAFQSNGLTEQYPLQAIGNIHLYSRLDREVDTENQGDGRLLIFLSIIAVLILAIAWVNYVNLATAKALDRAKEVGIRKTLGAGKIQLVYQFLVEAVVFNVIALGLGILLVVTGLEYFNLLTGSSLQLNFIKSSGFWIITALIFINGVLFTGIYPSLVLSSFLPSRVLKGQLNNSTKGAYLRKTLVTFQFTISIALIIGAIIVFKQLEFMKQLKLGFDLSDVMVVRGPLVTDEETYTTSLESFKNELLKNTQITDVTASSNIPGEEIIWTNKTRRLDRSNDQEKNIAFVGVDHNYFSTLGIEIIAGRNFDKNYPADTSTVILNKAAVELFGFESAESAINKRVTVYDVPKTIIGVVDNYKQMSPKSEVAPILFPLLTDMNYYYIVKFATTDYQQLSHTIQATFNQFFPENPYDNFLLDDYFNRLYKNDEKFEGVFLLFTVLAIIIASIGLFSLASFRVIQRTKEIGIRKILGATLHGIVILLSREFIILIAIANVISWPITYFISFSWLENFANRIEVQLSMFLVAGILTIVIAMLTIAIKTINTAKANPVEALKYE